MSDGSHRPALVATYRLQVHPGFTFADAAAVLPYLAGLGISHLYLSPVQQAVPGSLHGYDQCDPGQLSADLGGEAGFRVLAAAAKAQGLGIILDIVPNHMAAHASNPWWWELLRSGREGARGSSFDVDWEIPDAELNLRVMVPVLPRPLVEVLEAGELSLEHTDGGPVLVYGDQRFPVAGAAGRPVGAVLADQNYLLAHWREAILRLNYRRFFDINSLIALRQEVPEVFEAVHQLPLQLVAEGLVQGLRVDHVDGLRDPSGYLDRLRARAGDAWILVEKILEPGERLAPGWPVAGTTGYEFIQRVDGVFIDPRGEAPLTALYERLSGSSRSYREIVAEAKTETARDLFAPDIARIGRLLEQLCARAGVAADAAGVTTAIEAVGVHLRVYRTYLGATGPASDLDIDRIDAALTLAMSSADPAVLGVLRAALVERADEVAAELSQRFQQLTGPLMAKGVEDTAFYRYNRLVALNEVGGDPGQFGHSVESFHQACANAADQLPEAMLASSTHDTKRSEDVRARLGLLTEQPGRWMEAVERWMAINRRCRTDLVDAETEYVLYQALVGAWPITPERAQAYMEKAVREAKRHTSWLEPNQAYEAAVRDMVSEVMGNRAFIAELEAFVAPLVEPGRRASLARTLLKLTAPGIPDIYQGTEAWDLSLVDPDNRRPVDYGLRRRLLAASPDGTLGAEPSRLDVDAGLAKVHLVRRTLELRRRLPSAFGPGSSYTPLRGSGPAAENLVAYARGNRDDPMAVVVVVPRLVLGSPPAWSETTLELPGGAWHDLLFRPGQVEGPSPCLADLLEPCLPLLLVRADGD